MLRRAAQLLVLLIGLLVTTIVHPLAARAAQAAPKPTPMTITIEGEEFAEPLVVRSEVDAVLFAAVMDQVSWMRGTGQSKPPKAAALGRKYTIVVHSGDVAKQTYDLYPLAEGGPRAFRPSRQPDKRETTAAWFYGRLTMSETLRAAGVPLPEQSDTVSGGIGGGDRVNVAEPIDTSAGIDRVLADLRRLMLLNAGVVLAITAGLAGIALLVRRRTR